MKYRKFGSTDLMVSEIGFGAWAIGGGLMVGDTAIGWGDADDQQSKKAIGAALDAGINFFDTADIYGLGHSEELLGKEIGKNNEVIIASKVGNVARNGAFTVDYSPEYIHAACEASLKRLKREVIDYYQLHTARLTHLQQGDCIAAMEQLQRKGNIRYWGLSLNTFEPAPEANLLVENKKGAGFQLVLNILNQRALPVISSAASSGFGVIARMPLQFGLLTGKFDEKTEFASNDHRKKRLPSAFINKVAVATTGIWALCEKYNCDKTTLALSYILAHKGVSTVIPGIRTAAHVTGNTKMPVQIAPEDLVMIESLYETDLVPVVKELEQLG